MDKISLLLTSLCFSLSFGQDSISISFKEIEKKALENNLQIQLSKKEIALSEAELLKTRAMYLPNIQSSYTFSNTNNPLYAFGSKLNQERITMMDFNPNLLNSPKSISNFATKIEMQQPILNLDAVYEKNAGKVRTEVLKIQAERTQEYITFVLQKAYMQLQVAYQMGETLEKAKNTALANKKVIDNYYKNGLIKKSEVLNMEVRLLDIDNQLHYAQTNIKNASDYLLFLLNEKNTNTLLKPIDELTKFDFPLDIPTQLNLQRKDLQAYEKSLESYEWLIKSHKAKNYPKLNAFGSFEMYDKNLAQFNANGYLVGLQLSWNIFDGLKSKSEQEKYKLEIEKTKTEIQQYINQNQLELNQSIRNVFDTENKVKLSQKAFEQSKEAYRISQNRYQQGLEKSTDLLLAETQMSQKELEYINAIFEYNIAVIYLNFLTQ